VLRQAIQEGVKPVAFVNKIDRLILETKDDPETIYQKIQRILETLNSVIMTYSNDESLQVSPLDGTVGFGSAYFGWGFTLNTFAKAMTAKVPENREKVMKKLWGDNFYDEATKKWSTRQTPDSVRGFCRFVLGPIFAVRELCYADDKEGLAAKLALFNAKLTVEEYEFKEKALYGVALKRMIPLINPMLELIIDKLPSPSESQKNRVDVLYDGDLTDDCAEGIRTCDEKGPLMIYISKMIPEKTGRFIAFGRVFSGTLKSGMKVNILGPNYHVDESGRKADYHQNVTIQRSLVMIAGKFEAVSEIKCGNTCAIVGVDNYILKTGTITNSPTASPIKTMKFSVSPVVKVAVRVKDMSKLQTLIDGINKLSHTDPCIECKTDPVTKETTIAATGELHLEICLNDLKDFIGDVELIVSEPVVPFEESVTKSSSLICLAKSPNGLNRVFVSAEPLSPELINDIHSGFFDINSSTRARTLVEKYGWNPDDARKIIGFGPPGRNTNVLVDVSRGVPYFNEIKETCLSGFHNVMSNGPLGKEYMRGVRINIHDAMVHADAVHRGGAQIEPAMRRACFAAILSASPTLYEPIFIAEITTPLHKIGSVYSCLNTRRGKMESQEDREGTPLTVTKAKLPVAESFGINDELRSTTGGESFITLSFNSYDQVPGDYMEEGTKNNTYISLIRKRKGMKDAMPVYTDYLDRL
jgi:elongation factor 2